MLMLSTEQTRVVMHGIDNKLSWREIDRPVGPQPIPDWCTGVHVDWVEGYSNSPRIRLKVTGDVREWPEKRFVCEGGKFYRARHEDGRMEQYAHGGAVAPAQVQRWRSADGTIRQYRRSGPEWAETGDRGMGLMSVDGDWAEYGYEPGEWVEITVNATAAQQGFGGAHIPIMMEDGSDLVLRGPWHVGAPEGYAEVSYIDVSKPDRWYQRRGKPWHHRTARAGLYLRHDTFTAIMARFAAHLPLASVTYGGATTLEPFKAEWGEPKRLVYEREWLARKAAREAAKTVGAA